MAKVNIKSIPLQYMKIESAIQNDADLLVETGIYPVNHFTLNTPLQAPGSFIIVLRYNIESIHHLHISKIGGIWMRSQDRGVWNDWKQMAFASDILSMEDIMDALKDQRLP